MNRKTARLLRAIEHREAQYDKALDGLIAGAMPVEYVTERFKKLKEIKGGK